jgi:hypothetical protein
MSGGCTIDRDDRHRLGDRAYAAQMKERAQAEACLERGTDRRQPRQCTDEPYAQARDDCTKRAPRFVRHRQ